jgi:hypothetical protein
MSEPTGIEQIIAGAVNQALEHQLPALKDAIIRAVVEQMQHMPTSNGSAGTSSEPSSAGLLEALAHVQAGSTQKEILRALVESSAPYSGRSALFVVKSGLATGWQGRGFEHSDSIKDCALDTAGGAVYEALHSRTVARGNSSEIDAAFVSTFGAPSDDRVLVLPLLLKDKVAALVYADPGTSGLLDSVALEILVKATSAWLEVASLRKQSQKEESAAQADVDAPPVQAVTSFSDPFASHAPSHIAASASGAAAATAMAPVAVAAVEMSAEDADVHRKAQRFARLLMDEIKLYNQAKVAEGRKNRDLYDRLKDDVEKSRESYVKRYGNTVAANAEYFSHEIVRSLAEDDISLMGANFHG